MEHQNPSPLTINFIDQFWNAFQPFTISLLTLEFLNNRTNSDELNATTECLKLSRISYAKMTKTQLRLSL